MAPRAAKTRRAQDGLIQSFYDTLASTRLLAEERIADLKNLRIDVLETADISRSLLGNRVDETVDGFRKVHDEVVALAQAHMLICEELENSFIAEWKKVRKGP